MSEIRYYAVGCDLVSVRVETCGRDPATGNELIKKATVVYDYGKQITAGTDFTAEVESELYREVDVNLIDFETTCESDCTDVRRIKRVNLPCAFDVDVTNTNVGDTLTVDAAANDTLCADDPSTTWTLSNVQNANVVNNNDGTFDVDVLPSACGVGWSFDYTVSCPEGEHTATVSGDVPNDTLTIPNFFSVQGLTTINLNVGFTGVSTIRINWGDGSFTDAPSGNTTHTYAAPYTGNIGLEYSSCATITSITANNARITSLNVDPLNETLTYLTLRNNLLGTFNIQQNLVLDLLLLQNNGLTSLNVNQYPNIRSLQFHVNNLTALDISMTTNIDTLYAFSNSLNSPSVSNALALLNNQGKLNGRVSFVGGTNASPNPAGTAAANSLVAKGWRNQAGGLPIIN